MLKLDIDGFFSKKNHNSKRPVIAISILLAVFLIFCFSSSAPISKDIPGFYVFNSVYSFVQFSFLKSSNKIKNIIDNYIYLVDVKKKNKELKKKIKILEIENARIKHHKSEINRLSKLLEFKYSFFEPLKLARIVSRWHSQAFETYRIDLGTKDQVLPGLAVISKYAIVGRILRSNRYFADVQSLIHPDMYVDVLVERTRLRGIINGYGAGLMQWQPAIKEDIKIGDVLISSGLIGIFPKGLPVAKVIKIIYSLDQTTQTILLKPYHDPKKIEELFVVMTKNQLSHNYDLLSQKK